MFRLSISNHFVLPVGAVCINVISVPLSEEEIPWQLRDETGKRSCVKCIVEAFQEDQK